MEMMMKANLLRATSFSNPRSGLVCLAALLAVGCASSNGTSDRRGGSGAEGTQPALRVSDERFPGTRARMNNVGLLDDELGSKIAVEMTNGKRTPSNTVEAWAQLRNRTDHPQQLECRVLWYFADESPAEEPTAWQRLFLDPNSFATCKGLSTRIDVEYYYIEVRAGR